jgi:hypothetical protein
MSIARRHLLQQRSNAQRVLQNPHAPHHLKLAAKELKDRADILLGMQDAARRSALKRTSSAGQ